MPRWWIPPQFIIQLHAISVKGDLAVIIWIIWINLLCGWHFPIWSYYVLQWSLVQCEWIVERKSENKPLQNHICCQKWDYLFTTTTSQSFPTNSFTGEIGSGSNGSKAIASQRASTKKDYEIQISTMVYAMGGNANEILKSFHLSERSLTYDRMKSRFETQLWALRILFWTSTICNKWLQGEEKSVVDFIGNLYELAENFWVWFALRRIDAWSYRCSN